GEQAPVYAIKFELYENGISRALVLDYNDFAISGELTSLEVRDTKPCK
ncbi:MAG: EipB family protein, partial [Xanthobacteraceae bacterium]